MTTTPPDGPAGDKSARGRNRTCDLRFRKPSLYPPQNDHNPRSSEIESYFRAIVVAGLLPCLLDVAVGFAPPRLHDEHAMLALRLVETRRRGARLGLTQLGTDVLHQLAALQVAGPLPVPLAWWAHPLFSGDAPSPYGRQLLAWLRFASLRHHCATPGCEGAVVGVELRCTGIRVLACAEHRSRVDDLALGPCDAHLAGVPAAEVAHG